MLSNAQRRALAQMGIDVWVRRAVPVSGTPTVVAVVPSPLPGPRPILTPTPTPTRSPAPTRPAAAAPPGVSEQPVAPRLGTAELRVLLDCIAAPGVVLVGELGNPLDRRLAQDIVQAIAGMTVEVQGAQFRWPQTQTGDATPAAARNAYRGFLRGQLERASARSLLLLGAGAAALTDQETNFGDVVLLALPDARALRADPVAKKRLWLSVSPLVHS